jgi:deoxyribose-phosphate aldolase
MNEFTFLNLPAKELEARIARIISREVPEHEYRNILFDLVSFIDLTSLEGTDNDEKITSLCRKALSFADKGLPAPASVCIYSPFIKTAKKILEGSGIRITSVTGSFPSGQSPLQLRIAEARYAVDQGADEIDMVISRGRFLEGDYQFVADEISAIREVSGNLVLKVILETGELGTTGNIRKASEIAISAGADFIKTSTGKSVPAATLLSVAVMAGAIQDHFLKTKKRIGIKPAGGISHPMEAVEYYKLIRFILGDEWLNNRLFRIGASSLADNITTEFLSGSV